MEKTNDIWWKLGFFEAFPPFLQAVPHGHPVLHTNCFVKLSLLGRLRVLISGKIKVAVSMAVQDKDGNSPPLNVMAIENAYSVLPPNFEWKPPVPAR